MNSSILNLKFLDVLEERIKSKESISSIKKASIIPNFECNRINSLDYKTTPIEYEFNIKLL